MVWDILDIFLILIKIKKNFFFVIIDLDTRESDYVEHSHQNAMM